MKDKIKYDEDKPQDNMKRMMTHTHTLRGPCRHIHLWNPQTNTCKICKEKKINPPSIVELSEITESQQICPTCGRPFNDNIKF